VVVRHGSFDSTILLKGEAYGVALELREAQVRSVSASRGTSGFDFPFGVTFTPYVAGVSDGKTYSVYQFRSTSTTEIVRNDISEFDPDLALILDTITIDKSMRISDICVTAGASNTCKGGGLTRLDISFKRPEFKALFYATKTSGPPLSSTIDEVKIKLDSPNNPGNVFVVVVSKLGQISVYKE
jgi:hypothetical protein